MTDYGHELRFGTFLTPANDDPERVIGLAQLTEEAGLDLVTFQDHPYQPGFLDTWTLLSYVAARTSRITLAGNVLNLPLRQPAVLARSAASLDLLSGGRVELGLGAGAFWEAIVAMGGRRLTPGQSVQALAEAIEIIRGIWNTDERGVLKVDGEHYRVAGAKRGPAPAHPIEIWLGAYKPRMLRLVGRAADGWLPSVPYLSGLDDLARGNEIIDEAAAAEGRDPAAIRRLLNVNGVFARSSQGFLTGPADQWVEELTELALAYGISVFILGSDDPETIQRFGGEVAPAVRELVAKERERPRTAESPGSALVAEPPVQPAQAPDAAPGQSQYDRLGVTPTPDDGTRLHPRSRELLGEDTRPSRPESGPDVVYDDVSRALGRHLIDVHDHLRAELRRLRELIDQVRQGALSAGDARSAINEMSLRQHNWSLGAYCAAYCRVVTQHHTLEDDAVFPHLRAQEKELEPVIDRLTEEHHVIHRVLNDVDRALVEFITHPGDFTPLQDAVDLLTDVLLSHLAYEERELVEPLARYGFYAGQVHALRRSRR
ncbi:LLM class flavin-dependent oxidoreductase [Thermobispora bispora]|jgi:alkanesulfonate monooxygenase SsuD/methylene tetrahydromethanopterin reductase-like flavin-dependent oxidoreductase (luciferase family)|uniref:Luciferase-like monooxygenase n=1 Tax=Thermobispora bispora (strain ATCC 19993 / DSM 43833 / CBS 139.67 / JCM 10125 / KCTC 9307 / NBRC 14880 / R51) TaxID=469371 RepID=D6Y4L0_THEBD|nr:Luciferase-like monooxygenase [Thermobispora bispora DSM 43833]MBO2475467.1 LLM class flavin-dependent oxidoreductase [Actinomycetales bacterium]QSI48892.1 LLM class flavin-dependent oxidoreductase [Thermobispora bispora]